MLAPILGEHHGWEAWQQGHMGVIHREFSQRAEQDECSLSPSYSVQDLDP